MDDSKRKIGLRSLILYVFIFLLGCAFSRYWEDQISFVSREEFGHLIKKSQRYEANTLSWKSLLVETELRLIEHGDLMHPRSLLFKEPRRHWYVFIETEQEITSERQETLRELSERKERVGIHPEQEREEMRAGSFVDDPD